MISRNFIKNTASALGLIFSLFTFFSMYASENKINSHDSFSESILSTYINSFQLQDHKIVITKDTTEEELQVMKKEMEDSGVYFDYSNLKYNDAGEITAITIKYKDGNNNAGSYSVDSDSAINTILIMSKDNSMVVRSTGSGNQATINQGGAYQENASTKNREKMDQMQKEMDMKRTEMRENMNTKRKEIRETMDEARERRFIEMKEKQLIAFGTFIEINKDATTEELDRIKEMYAAKEISFSYNNVERNEADEITKISLELENNNGSLSKATYYNNDEPINPVKIGANHEGTFLSKNY